MTEQTDKTTDKPAKTLPAKKRAGKSRSPSKKQAKAPGGKPAKAKGDNRAKAANGKAAAAKDSPAIDSAAKEADGKVPLDTADTARALAPDPATITFGSNRPIVAAPPKLPASSGLRFSGPSDGQLKASGPQPTSAKASGLTFTNAKSPAAGNGKSAPAATAGAPKSSLPGEVAEAKGPGAKTAETRSKGTEKPPAGGENRKIDAKPGAGAKAGGPTKPAIAPQSSGRRLEKERSSNRFAVTLVALAAVVGGLTFWFNRNEVPSTPRDSLAAAAPQIAPQTAPQTAPERAPAASPGAPGASSYETVPGPAPEFAAAPAEVPATVPVFAPSQRAPESPGPLAGNETIGEAATGRPVAAVAELSAAEIGEIQTLLSRLDLDPGQRNGILSPQTSAAIRSYQDMAGLPADGEANKALLEELRSVVALYGG